MRIWIDMTAPAHPIVFRPVVRLLRDAGHTVRLTARDYAQTVDLCRLHGLDAEVIGAHGGSSRARKVGSLAQRTATLRHRIGRFKPDLAIAHGSNDLALVAASLGVPAVNTFDYEWATAQHNIGCRLARRVLVPEAIPAERLERYGAGPAKVRHYPGLKEEYYLADFEADRTLLARLGVDEHRVVVIVRPPPDVSLYHRHANPLFAEVLQHLGRNDDVHAVVIPRTEDQRRYVRSLALPSVIVPEGAVDGQSLIALADVVVSAGGTMNREAVALGTPVYTTYGGRLGGVDEWLIREGRLRPASDPRAIELVKRPPGGTGPMRDPQLLVDLMLEAA